jgi:hypothetical protein
MKFNMKTGKLQSTCKGISFTLEDCRVKGLKNMAKLAWFSPGFEG